MAENEMKEAFVAPVVEVVTLEEDVIRTSGCGCGDTCGPAYGCPDEMADLIYE